jgi:hypothetical protein
MPSNSLRIIFMTNLQPVEGDLLPPLNSRVMIHHSSCNQWVPVTVTGYFVWGSEYRPNRYRVFVRVQDDEGIPNARELGAIKPCEGLLL